MSDVKATWGEESPASVIDKIAEIYSLEYDTDENINILQDIIKENIPMDKFVQQVHILMKEDAETMEEEVDEDELEDQGAAECPYCRGDAYPMGPAGGLIWFRCQNCGMDSNRRKE